MTQRLLPFKYELEKKEKKLTGLAGLFLYLELFKAMNLDAKINRILTVKKHKQGYRDDQIILYLLLLNLAGGDSVLDIEILERDEGFCQIMKSLELKGTIGRKREKIRRRWRRDTKRKVASCSSIFRYLLNFHDEQQEQKREKAKAFIPASNEYLLAFKDLNYEVIDFVQKIRSINKATLDMDATISNCRKRTALCCYEGGKGYQPFNVWWHEQDLLLYTEFRDGNVPAGHQQLRVLKESLSHLPEGVEQVYIRSDSAGYQHELLRYCDRAESERFKRINFAIGVDISDAFKKAILTDNQLQWHEIYKRVKGEHKKTGQQWAEVCFVPNAIATSKKGLEYRYIAIREELKQKTLPGMEDFLELPFPTIEISKQRYKLTAIVTNLDWQGEELIHWYRQRAGKGEEVHSMMKEDFSGGKFPSWYFGVNAAWWWIAALALNINSIMKQFVLKGNWKRKRMKSIRFNIIDIAGRILIRGKMFIVRLAEAHPSFELLLSARQRIMELACLPSG